MYAIILKEDSTEVEQIIQNPTDEQKELGYLVDSLTEVGVFTKIDDKLYFIKEMN